MDKQDQLFQHISKVEDFAFDERVASVFDNMVARSVPFYDEIQRMQADLAVQLLPANGVVCDLGCSTGTTLMHIAQHQQCPQDTQLLGYDNSSPMLEQAKRKLALEVAAGRVNLQLADLNQLSTLPPCHVVVLNWTLQFVRPIARQALLDKIYTALLPGGALFLSEKILADDPVLNRVYIEHYLHFKTTHSGYTDAENQRKREALENVLVPYRLDENYALLGNAGFQRIDTYFRWFNFACMIAVKV